MLEGLVYFGIIFVVISLVYLLFVNKARLRLLGLLPPKKGKKKGTLTEKNVQNLGEASYVIVKFKLDKAKIDFKLLFTINAFINAFIIALTSMILSLLDLSILWRMMIGFVLLFALIYATYEIYGRILVKKGWKK